MTQVFVVMTGERYEGGRLLGIFDNGPAAAMYASTVEAAFPESWQPELVDAELPTELGRRQLVGYWTAGCDWLSIEAWPVQS